MRFIISSLKSLSIFELLLWNVSLTAITTSFFVMRNTDYLTLAASLVGATSLIFLAKGNVIGQVLVVAFAALYGIISYGLRYYGEMITYLGMTAPIAIASIITWLGNSFNGNKTSVKINTLKTSEYIVMLVIGCAVTIAFYFILMAFDTANLIYATVSVFTSFIASYLELRRSPYYAVAFVANDVVLIVLWTLAAINDINYISMVVCFCVFVVNDLYGFVNWLRTRKIQHVVETGNSKCKEVNDVGCDD